MNKVAATVWCLISHIAFLEGSFARPACEHSVRVCHPPMKTLSDYPSLKTATQTLLYSSKSLSQKQNLALIYTVFEAKLPLTSARAGISSRVCSTLHKSMY